MCRWTKTSARQRVPWPRRSPEFSEQRLLRKVRGKKTRLKPEAPRARQARPRATESFGCPTTALWQTRPQWMSRHTTSRARPPKAFHRKRCRPRASASQECRRKSSRGEAWTRYWRNRRWWLRSYNSTPKDLAQQTRYRGCRRPDRSCFRGLFRCREDRTMVRKILKRWSSTRACRRSGSAESSAGTGESKEKRWDRAASCVQLSAECS